MEKREEHSYREAMRKAMADDLRKGGGGNLFNLPPDKKVKIWKGPKGNETIYIDILPYEVTIDNHLYVQKGAFWYRNDVLIHTSVGPQKRAYVCPKTVNKRCPICDHREELAKEGVDENTIKALYPKRKQIFNLDAKSIDKDSDAEVYLWMHSKANFGALLSKILDRKSEEYFDFFLLKNGFTLKVEFEEKKWKQATYYEALSFEFLERDAYPESILKDTLDLDKILNVPSYDDLKVAFLGIDEGEEETPEDEKELFAHDHAHRRERENKEDETHTNEEVERPRRRREPETVKETTQTRQQERENPCPFGHKFGIDTEMMDDCRDCGDEWEACMKAKEQNKKEARRRREQKEE